MWSDYIPNPRLVSFQIGVLCLPKIMTIHPCPKYNNLVSVFFTHMHRAPTSTKIHFSVGCCLLASSFLLKMDQNTQDQKYQNTYNQNLGPILFCAATLLGMIVGQHWMEEGEHDEFLVPVMAPVQLESLSAKSRQILHHN